MKKKLWDKLKRALLANATQKIQSEETTVHFGEILDETEKRAATLASGLYAIRCKKEINTAFALLTCFCAGVTAIPLSDRYGALHCDRILSTVNADFLISDETGELIVIPLKQSHACPFSSVTPSLIMYTSGTTGIPKGAMLTEDNILSNLDSIGDYLKINSEDCIMIARPLYHCAVLTGEFLMSILRGVRIVFCSEPFHPFVWSNIISEKQVSVLGGTPTLLFNLCRLMKESKKLKSLKKIIVSGERMTKSVATEIRKTFPQSDIYSVYGLTEACPRVAALPPTLFDSYPESCGVPIKGVTVRVVDENGAPVADGTVGELQVRGDNVMLGYYNNRISTEKALKDGWLCTGDMAYKDERGLIYVKGRQDDMLIHAGINIYPQEIESVIGEYPGVASVLVVGEDDERCGQKIIAQVVGENLNERLLREYCRTHLPDFECPSEIRIVTEIPRNGSGKVVRKIQ